MKDLTRFIEAVRELRQEQEALAHLCRLPETMPRRDWLIEQSRERIARLEREIDMEVGI